MPSLLHPICVRSFLSHTNSLESLLHPCADGPQAIVYLARRLSEDQTDDRLACNARVLEAA